MLSKFNKYIRENALFTQNDTVLVALSGGLDSCVLVSLLLEGGYNFSLAHMNFGLRGIESDEDQEFVHHLAESLRCPLFVKKVDLTNPAYSGSTQMKARQARYEWFTELMHDNHLTYLATAHHADDHLETILLQLGRGGRLETLSGILNINEKIRRPLLFASRQELQDYARAKGLKWREDSSNKDDKYQRNYIRHHITPELKELYPSLLGSLNKQYKHNRMLLDFVQTQLKSECERYLACKNTEELYIDKALRKHPQAALLLSHILEPYEFNEVQSEEILSTQVTGTSWITQHWQCWNDREHWILKSILTNERAEYLIEAFTTEIKFGNNFNLKFSFTNPSEYKASSHIAWLNAEALQFPLRLRPAREGDRIQPLGMEGKKKISDLLIDMKVSRPDKEHVWVIESGDELVWVLGYRISHKFRLLPETERVYKIDFR